MINVSNQKPCVIDDAYAGGIGAPFDMRTAVEMKITNHIFTPLMPNTTVSIDIDGKPIDKDDVTNLVFDCSSENLNTSAEAILKDIFTQTLQYYPENEMSIQDAFAIQSAVKSNILFIGMNPNGSRVDHYDFSDVTDVSKRFLAGAATRDEFFATLSFASRICAFGFYFVNDAAWCDFKTWFAANMVAPIATKLDAATTKLCSELQQIKLNNALECFAIRNNDTENNEDYSFARILHSGLMQYERYLRSQNQPEFVAGHLPFALGETFCPRNIVLINAEKHARMPSSALANEWHMLQNALYNRSPVVGLDHLSSLMATQRLMDNIMKGCDKSNGPAQRAAVVKFREKPLTFVDIYKYVKMVYDHCRFVQISENATKFKKRSYNKSNRRRPDDPDAMGVITSINYKPDLHVYLDGSGSVGEREYRDGLMAVIKLAKKLGVNIFFSSFSHVLSQPYKLSVAGKTEKQIYDEIKKLPKVTGGTNYEQIWHYINKSDKRRKRVSIIISDFEYTVPNHYVHHPDYLFYAPVSSSNWKYVVNRATTFVKDMSTLICPNIRKHILM